MVANLKGESVLLNTYLLFGNFVLFFFYLLLCKLISRRLLLFLFSLSQLLGLNLLDVLRNLVNR